MNVLITGCCGFIGSHLAEFYAKQGHRVIGVDSLLTGKLRNIDSVRKLDNFDFIQIDVSDYISVERIFKRAKYFDVVFHQAALGSVPRSFGDPRATFKNNVDGFQRILEACVEFKSGKIVFASSSSVYGKTPKTIRTEGLEGKIKSPYAMSKSINELQAKSMSETYGLKYYGLRYFNVFGPRQDPKGAYAAVIPKWAEAMKYDQDVYIYGDGETARDFTYITNVINANILCAISKENYARNTFYNVGCSKLTTLTTLANDMLKIMDSKSKIIYVDERQGDIKKARANLRKAQNLLGYRPIVNYKNGLELYLEHFKKEKKK